MRVLVRTVAVLALCAASMPARAQTAAVVVAGPGSARTPYYTTIVSPAARGDDGTFVNADVSFHNMRSRAIGSDDAPWCGPLDPSQPESTMNPRRYARGSCPLFFAELATPLTGRSSIQGLSSTEPGKTYEFFCEVFPGMRGILAITA